MIPALWWQEMLKLVIDETHQWFAKIEVIHHPPGSQWSFWATSNEGTKKEITKNKKNK
jgi:hypothetical protein